jgi:hypothetical protein
MTGGDEQRLQKFLIHNQWPQHERLAILAAAVWKPLLLAKIVTKARLRRS